MQLRTLFTLLAAAALLALVLGLFTGCSDSQSASGALTINPAPNLHPESPVPLYVAARSGNGAWQRLQAGGNGGYTAPVSDPDGRYTVLMVMDRRMQGSTRVTQGYGDVILVHGTVQEMPILWYGFGDSNPLSSPYTVSGSISNAPTSPYTSLEVRMGRYGMWSSDIYNRTSYQLYNPPPAGTWDLVAYTRSHISFVPEAFIVQRNIAMTGDLVRNLDFSTVVPAEAAQCSLSGGEWGDTYAYVEGITANGTELNVSDFYENQSTVPFVLLPQPASGDLYRVYGQVTDDNAVVQLTAWYASLQNRTVPLPEQFTGATVDYSGAAPVIDGLEYSSAIHGTAKGYQVDLWGIDDDENWHDWSCYLTPGALRGTGDFTLPAPSNLPGWNDDWSLPMAAGPERRWRIIAFGGTLSTAELLSLHLNGGSRYNVLHHDGTALYSASCESETDR
ncbi:MAG: hypothetical protein ACYDCO_15260 [Armatimonadota bacterium]